MWIMLQNWVWTADRLLLREWPNCYFCQLCWRNLETAVHLFSECPTTRAIWSSISSWCSWTAMNPSCWRATDDLEVWFFGLMGTSNSPAAKGARSLAILVTWTIWCERNRQVFNEEVKSTARIIDEIKEASRLWISASAKHLAFLVDRHISE